jgi:isoleucyl-tRNA synthetase
MFLSMLQDLKKTPAYGTDVLRLWVANTEYTKDVSVGPTVIGMYGRLIALWSSCF